MLLVPQVIHLIVENYHYDEVTASKECYSSKVYSCFEALHTTGENYIIEDIDLYIEARQAALPVFASTDVF